MQPAIYPHINEFLNNLLTQMRSILGDKLVGLYLYGSLLTGDYDDNLSDVDLMAALMTELTDTEFDALKKMHEGFAQNPRWDNRFEIAYLTLHTLKTFKTERSDIGIISPGEPFHYRDAGIDWLMNWYYVSEIGLPLYGPPPKTIIIPISKEEFLTSIRNHILSIPGWIDSMSHHHGSQAYVILTMCRGLYTLRHGEYTSKGKAAAWALEEFPQWEPLIRDALFWRQKMHEYGIIPEPPFEETKRFMYFGIEQAQTQE